MKPDYIFISGVSRTGSTLLLRTLNKSTEIALTRENYFLGHQLPWEGLRHIIKKNVGDLSDERNVHNLVEFLYHGKFKRSNHGYIFWLRKRIDKETFLQNLLVASDRDDRGLFVILMKTYGYWLQQVKAQKTNRPMSDNPVLGEKTPSHLYYVPTLLDWFPNAKIVHTFRDPRAIFASEFRRRKQRSRTFPYTYLKKWEPVFTGYILLQVTYTWLRAARLHFTYQEQYPNSYYLHRFEDVVTDSEKSIRRLCEFLGIDFQEAMLEQKVVSRGFAAGKKGFDRQAADRWKELNPGWVNAWFHFWGKKYLSALDYGREIDTVRTR